jgi:glycosyltransferase involved in cell wall biosynthesis
VICSDAAALPEVAGDAALYANADDHHQLASQMMSVYKDEVLRQSLISRGITQAAKYSWDRSAELLWNSIEKAVSK